MAEPDMAQQTAPRFNSKVEGMCKKNTDRFLNNDFN